MNTKQYGTKGLGAAIKYFTSHGNVVSIPLNDSQDYDLVVDIDGRLYKIDVKHSHSKCKYGKYRVSLRKTGGNRKYNWSKNFDNTKIDYLFIVLENGKKYLIDPSRIENKSQITPEIKYSDCEVMDD